jgi:hypothetical protein
MRTALFMLAGFLLLAGSMVLAKQFAGIFPASRCATIVFIAGWFAIAALNMWAGVAKAGYSVAEELPVLLLIFGLPAVAAALLHWKLG